MNENFAFWCDSIKDELVLRIFVRFLHDFFDVECWIDERESFELNLVHGFK